MAIDQLILGGVVFDAWMTPADMPFGGKQAMKVWKLPGGSRVIDILGPDEMEIAFKGQIWGNDAADKASALNDMRIAGNPVALSYGGNFYVVIVESCVLHIRRYPQWYEYDISCTVSSNPMAGGSGFGGSSSVTDIVGADMASALSVLGL
jgi:hypothetical protein